MAKPYYERKRWLNKLSGVVRRAERQCYIWFQGRHTRWTQEGKAKNAVTDIANYLRGNPY